MANIVCAGWPRVRYGSRFTGLLLCLLTACVAKANLFTWSGAGGDGRWTNPANWTPRDALGENEPGYPQGGSAATIANGDSGVLEINVDGGSASAPLRVGSVRFEAGGPIRLFGNPLKLTDPTLAFSAACVVTNDIPLELSGGDAAGISISAGITNCCNGVISGTGKLCKTGAGHLHLIQANTYTGGTLVQNGYLDVWNMNALGTSTEPVQLASNGSTTYGRLYICINGTFAYPLQVGKNTAGAGAVGNANVYFMAGGKLTGAVTGLGEGARLGLRTANNHLTVDATVDLPDGELLNYPGSKQIHYKRRVIAKNMDVGNSTNGGTGDLYWYSPENEFVRYHCSYRNTHAMAENVFGTNSVVSFGYREGGRSVYDLANHDQTIDHLDYSKGDVFTVQWDWRKMKGHEVRGGTGAGARFTMRSTEDTICDADYQQKVTLVWWPRGNYTYTTFDNGGDFGRVSTMTGALVISNGTFAVTGTNAFPNVTAMEIAPGATFAWRSASVYTSSGLTGGLIGVKDLVVGAGATNSFDEGAVWPYGERLTRLALASDALLDLAEGKQLTADRFEVDGVPQNSGLYTGADNSNPGDAVPLTCLRGTGTVASLGEGAAAPIATEAVWTGASDEDMGTAANWKDGVLPVFDRIALQAVFSEPLVEGQGGRVVVSGPYLLNGLTLNGACDVSFVPNGDDAKLTLQTGGIVCAAPETEKRAYTVEVPLELRTVQTWEVPDNASLTLLGPMTTSWAPTVAKTGSGSLYLHATNSSSTCEILVSTGLVHVAGNNAFGGAGGQLTLRQGCWVEFHGGMYDASLNATLGSKTGHLRFVANTTNVFNDVVTFNGGTYFNVGSNTLTEFKKTMSSGSWTYVYGSGPATSVLRFDDRLSIAGGQYGDVTFDLRAPGNTIGTGDLCLKYGDNVHILLNCPYALNSSQTITSWRSNNRIDLCGNDNKVGTLDFNSRATIVTNSGAKATLWVEQTATQGQRDDAARTKYPIVMNGDFAGPTTLGKLGAAPLIFTNRAVSSTGDIVVHQGTVAFCPQSSWLGAETVVVSNRADGAAATLEIRQAQTLNKHVTVYLAAGGRMTLGLAGEDASFTQSVDALFIDGVKQHPGLYSADIGGGRPSVARTTSCASLQGPGVLLVRGGGTVILFK